MHRTGSQLSGGVGSDNTGNSSIENARLWENISNKWNHMVLSNVILTIVIMITKKSNSDININSYIRK